jgi:hypothetical protein
LSQPFDYSPNLPRTRPLPELGGQAFRPWRTYLLEPGLPCMMFRASGPGRGVFSVLFHSLWSAQWPTLQKTVFSRPPVGRATVPAERIGRFIEHRNLNSDSSTAIVDLLVLAEEITRNDECYMFSLQPRACRRVMGLFMKCAAEVAKNFLDFQVCFRKTYINLARRSFGA